VRRWLSAGSPVARRDDRMGPGLRFLRTRTPLRPACTGLAGALRIRRDSGEAWETCGAARVKPDAMHEVEVHDTTALIAFLESESDLGAALVERVREDITRIDARDVARWRVALGEHATVSASHPRVKRVLRYVRDQLGAENALSLQNLAKMAGLSPSRFMHVFTEAIGVPLRPYILWVRLQRASGELNAWS
jgi:hypothetical protein